MRIRLFLAAMVVVSAFGSPTSAATFFERLFSSVPPAAPQSQPRPTAPMYGGSGFFGTPGGDQQYSGRALYPDMVPPDRVVPSDFRRQIVYYTTDEPPGTIIVDTQTKFLYLVMGSGQAVRYGVGVGRTGFGWRGTVRVGGKAEWPDWRPPPAMIARERARGHILPAFMPGGPNNPLGARALYLHNSSGDTGYRIHGTSEPWTIGLNVSSGCIRLTNEDVSDLYQRVPIGGKVVVM